MGCFPGTGGRSGPDISDVGARTDREYLADAVLYPSKHIAPGYQRVTIVTTDGRTIRGVLKVSTPQYVEVKTSGGTVRLASEDIRTRRLDPISDMPEGLEDCSKLPKITEALLRKGYSDDDVRKILGGNTLRILEQAERVSREIRAQH